MLESEPVVRALLETAINVAWVGSDEARARAFKAESARQLRLWLDEIEKHQALPPEARSRGDGLVRAWQGTNAPVFERKLEVRAREATVDTSLLRIPNLYELCAKYRRLSGPSHGDLRGEIMAIENTSALAHLDAQDAATAMVVCVTTAAQTLGIEREVERGRPRLLPPRREQGGRGTALRVSRHLHHSPVARGAAAAPAARAGPA